MTLYDFNSLEFKDQLKTVYEIGAFLDNNITDTARCNLYAVSLFFCRTYIQSANQFNYRN